MMLHAHEYYTEAVTCYQLASQCDRQEFRWPYLLANLLENHDREAAAAAYRRAIEIQPELAQLHIRLAELCLDLGEFEQAEGELKTALESAPLNGQAQFRMAQLFFQRRDFATSLPWAKRAAEREPPRREVHELLLQLYHRLGEDEKSSEESRLLRTAAFAGGYWPDPYFEELKQLRRDPLWVAYQADQLLHAGNVPAALVILEQLVQQQPDDDVAREHLARALLHAHQQERAAEILDQGLAACLGRAPCGVCAAPCTCSVSNGHRPSRSIAKPSRSKPTTRPPIWIWATASANWARSIRLWQNSAKPFGSSRTSSNPGCRSRGCCSSKGRPRPRKPSCGRFSNCRRRTRKRGNS